MSMCHKAYVLDWDGFETELRSAVEHALTFEDGSLLLAFAYSNVSRLRFPDDDEPFTESWLAEHGDSDIQMLADVALTAFYDPNDYGVGERWHELDDRFSDPARLALLGRPIGPPGNRFDPGRMGAYFQSPAMAAASLEALGEYDVAELQRYLCLVRHAAQSGSGLYVTF